MMKNTIRSLLASVGAAAFLIATSGIAAGAAEWHVAVNGTAAGNGSAEKPWDLATGLGKGPGVKGGDTVWVHGGTYQTGSQVNLVGAKDSPIVIRNYKNERATVASLDVGCTMGTGPSYLRIWGFEVTNRKIGGRDVGIYVGNSSPGHKASTDVKVINNIVHDCGGVSVATWSSVADGEYYGNVIYYSGYDEDGGRGHGHGFYIQHKPPDWVKIRDNIVFRHFNMGLQVWGSDKAFKENVLIEGNTFFSTGEISHSSGFATNIWLSPTNNIKVLSNNTYAPPYAPSQGNCNTAGNNMEIKDNYFVAPGPTAQAAWLGNAHEGYAMNDNGFYGVVNMNGHNIDPATYGKGNYKIAATGKKIFVRKNEFEPGRANITVYNWDKSDKVDVDVPEAVGLKAGDEYEVRDVQNWFDKPAATGKFDGKAVTIPMTGLTVAAPIGLTDKYKTPPHTAPQFGAFVILKAGTAGAK
jgi:hypothetical protein